MIITRYLINNNKKNQIKLPGMNNVTKIRMPVVRSWQTIRKRSQRQVTPADHDRLRFGANVSQEICLYQL